VRDQPSQPFGISEPNAVVDLTVDVKVAEYTAESITSPTVSPAASLRWTVAALSPWARKSKAQRPRQEDGLRTGGDGDAAGGEHSCGEGGERDEDGASGRVSRGSDSSQGATTAASAATTSTTASSSSSSSSSRTWGASTGGSSVRGGLSQGRKLAVPPRFAVGFDEFGVGRFARRLESCLAGALEEVRTKEGSLRRVCAGAEVGLRACCRSVSCSVFHSGKFGRRGAKGATRLSLLVTSLERWRAQSSTVVRFDPVLIPVSTQRCGGAVRYTGGRVGCGTRFRRRRSCAGTGPRPEACRSGGEQLT